MVLKMKAARARAITLSQLPLRVSEVLSMGRSVPEQGADGQVPRPSPRTTETPRTQGSGAAMCVGWSL